MRFRVKFVLLLICLLTACNVEFVVVPKQQNSTSMVLETPVPTMTETWHPVATLSSTEPLQMTTTPQPIVQSVESGEGHSCALISDGTVWCWGKNEYGQLGNGTTENQDVPVQVEGLEKILTLAVGWGHTCALSYEGAVWCWGYNKNGELGDGTTIHNSLPVLVKDLSDAAKALSVGDDHSCVITETGNVQCWGFNRSGQLGDGTTLNRNTAVSVVGVSGARMLAAGWEHTCVLTQEASVSCWGSNEFGQLGKATEEENMPFRIVLNGLGHEVGALTAGGGHTCALLFDGDVRCWGNNQYGQLGDGTTENRVTPASVLQLEGVSQIAAGGNHTCAVDENGKLLCWGWNYYGQLGYEARSRQSAPVPVTGLPGVVVDMGLGWQHTCIGLETGEIACWGVNEYGQVWNDWQMAPAAEACGQAKVARPLDSGGFHSCAITEAGKAICWGLNEVGQLGVGSVETYTGAVVVEGLGTDVVSVATGGNQSCALKTDGTVMCWGANYSGEIGDGTFSDRLEPVQVDGLQDDVNAIAAGGGHTCAALSEGVVCWGADNNNQRSNMFDKGYVIELQGCVQDIASLFDHTCAVTSAGAVYCWGLNDHGQLGDNTTIQKRGAVQVMGLESGFAHVATGHSHSCALTVNGRVKCWGDNTWGQLGDGTTESHLTAVDVVQGIERAVGIAAGFYHTCYLSTAGQVKCWGKGVGGQLGTGTRGTQLLPTEVMGLENVVYIEAGESHTCGLLADGTIKCWGDNYYGQLSDGGEVGVSSSVPVELIMSE